MCRNTDEVSGRKGGGSMKRVFVILTAALFLFLPLRAMANLEAHFLDVGQGDCTVILCDGEAMVIDGGPPAA